jgi:hypothetical protein
MVLFLALAVAHKHLNKIFAAVAGMIGVASWAVSFAWPTTDGGAAALVLLSDSYASAGRRRKSTVASAETLIALNAVPSAIGMMQVIGILVISLLMLRGPSRRALAWLGVATGVIGLVSEALRPVIGNA